MKISKGFTLIELLIVIAILAILATVAVLVINPAELLAQARDSQRISDLGTVHSALGLYIATVSSFDIGSGTTDTQCVASLTAANCLTNYNFDGGSSTLSTTSDETREVNGDGWVKAGFSDIPGGSPLAALPIDPTNSGSLYYTYWGHQVNKHYKLTANLESTRYTSGTDNKESTDGGVNATYYEIGNDLNMP